MSRHRPGTKAAERAMARWLRNQQGRPDRRVQRSARELTLHLAATVKVSPRTLGLLRQHLIGAHRILRPPLAELSLALVGDARMGRIHERFLGQSGPTDVMTFPLEFDSRQRATAGEVVVCVPEARRRARQNQSTPEKELLLYALHGLLHLSGYDDTTDQGYREMHRAEDMILTRLGVGPVFRPASEDPSAAKRRRRRPAGKGGGR